VQSAAFRLRYVYYDPGLNELESGKKKKGNGNLEMSKRENFIMHCFLMT
jgi:hypothetical protein